MIQKAESKISVSEEKTFAGEIESAAFGGNGILHKNNKVVFIPFSAPGDVINYRIIQEKQNFSIGEIQEILKPSPDRTAPPCPLYGKCGGCQFQHITYEASLREKSKILENLFIHGLGIKTVPQEKPLPSPSPYFYRNKLQAAVGKNEKGGITIGLFEPKTHKIVDMTQCFIEEEANNAALTFVRKGIVEMGWEPYNEETNSGLIRHILLRTNRKRETYLAIVAKNPSLPEWERFLKIINPEILKLKGLILNVNPDKTNAVLGRKNLVLWGEKFFEETIGNYQYLIGATSFFQVNSLILETLIQKVLEWTGAHSKDTILDAFCGIGTFTIPLAKTVKKVIGIENNKEAVELARKNSILNQVSNIEWIHGKVETALQRIRSNTFPIALLDPPRKGLNEKELKELIRLNPSKILYLSCNPPTQIRDVKNFLEAGWNLKKTALIDLFPQTAQIESLALLEKENIDRSLHSQTV
jgi:23S rRNA (uracil1939-C5)-methyltransferase